jgi:hypothetical protein
MLSALIPVITPSCPGQLTPAHAIRPSGRVRDQVLIGLVAARRRRADVEHGLIAEQLVEAEHHAARRGAARQAGDHLAVLLDQAVVDEPPPPRQPHPVRGRPEQAVVGYRGRDRRRRRGDHRRQPRREQAAVRGADRVGVASDPQHRDPAVPGQRGLAIDQRGRRAGRGLHRGDLALELTRGHVVGHRAAVNKPRDHDRHADHAERDPAGSPRPCDRCAAAADHEVRHARR